MNQHRYRVYYEFNGRSKGDPFRTEKTAEQIQDALDRFKFELSVILEDDKARMSILPESANSIVVTLETNQSDQSVLLSMKWTLQGLDLLATKLE